MENKDIVRIEEEGSIKCDNSTCDYVIPVPVQDYSQYVNKPCPKCGENLLTEEDFNAHSKVLETINFINSLTEAQLEHLREIFEIDSTKEKKEVGVSFSVENGIPNFKLIEE